MNSESETEDRIMEAAARVFLRRGTAGARMQEIAEEAGVNKALLHYYFRSKDRLATAVFRRAARELLPQVIGILAEPGRSIEEKVERVVEVELGALTRMPMLPGYILSELHHHPERAAQMVEGLTGIALNEMAPAAIGVLQAQLDTAAAEGRMRPISGVHFVVNLLSICIFPFAARPLLGVALGLQGERFDEFIEERRSELPDFIMKGLRP